MSNKRGASPSGNSLVGNSPTWQHRADEWDRGKAALAEVDRLAVDIELKWGMGRLRLLVPQPLRERFDAQRRKFNLAQASGDLENLITQCARMCAAWRAADKAASDAGASVVDGVWEIVLRSGETLAIVRSDIEVGLVQPRGRKLQVWSMEEIARIVEAQPEAVSTTKARFKGSVLAALAPVAQPAAPAFHDLPFDDPIPF